jgi:selenocysteine-specific elongation factor
MKQIVIGTAGHIDHGKTALIKALTGIDCDRLKEEKERGVTIELGFAHYRFADDMLVGIVDVPGHERFVKHMVAGAWGIDMVLFVVAADESVMPQTREHLDICELLGIKRGIIAITKKDLADDEMVELVKEEVRELVKGRFLEGAPIITVSSATGENMDVLREAIKKKADEIEEKSRKGIFRLPVDRVFTIRGFGTIVTGTCISGRVRVGDELEIYPAAKRARVRNIQAYHSDAKEAGAGQRVALNLQGVEKQEIERGVIISSPDTLLMTSRIDATLRYLKLPFKGIRDNAILRFHIATTQVEARLILLDRPTIEPGEEAFVQFVFAHPIVVLPGDRYILRGSYAIQTLGGGSILDIAPPKHKRSDAQLNDVRRLLETGTAAARMEYHIQKGGYAGITRSRLSVLMGMNSEAVDRALSAPEMQQKVRAIGKMVVPEARLLAYKTMLKELLREFREKNPLKVGMSREELRTRLPDVDQQVFQTALEELVKESEVEIEKDRVRLAGGAPKDRAVDKLEGRIVGILEAQGLTPPTTTEMMQQLSIAEGNLKDMLERLVYQGKIVKVRADMYFSSANIEQLKQTVKEQLVEKKEMLPADFKAVLGLSRKYMIPLLEYLDTIKLTIRTGDKRVLRSGS